MAGPESILAEQKKEEQLTNGKLRLVKALIVLQEMVRLILAWLCVFIPVPFSLFGGVVNYFLLLLSVQ